FYVARNLTAESAERLLARVCDIGFVARIESGAALPSREMRSKASAPISFLIGDVTLYSREERKSLLALPVVLFSDLDQATAHDLERLFRSRGVDVEARTGSGGHGRNAGLTVSWLASAVGGVWGAFHTALK